MSIKSKFLFILIGDDKHGKTTLQKYLIQKICEEGWYINLPTNLLFPIMHPEIKRKYRNISFGNRSYQEKKDEYYHTIENYFSQHFKDADIAFVSSHFVESDIRDMITEGHSRFFNVFGVFFTNGISVSPVSNASISRLNWDERLVLENPIISSENNADFHNQVDRQLNKLAESIVDFIINRTSIS